MTLSMSATDPSLYTVPCSWPLQPTVCTPLTMATTPAYPGPYLVELEVLFRTPIAIAATAMLTKVHKICNVVDPSGLS